MASMYISNPLHARNAGMGTMLGTVAYSDRFLCLKRNGFVVAVVRNGSIPLSVGTWTFISLSEVDGNTNTDISVFSMYSPVSKGKDMTFKLVVVKSH